MSIKKGDTVKALGDIREIVPDPTGESPGLFAFVKKGDTGIVTAINGEIVTVQWRPHVSLEVYYFAIALELTAPPASKEEPK